MSQRARPAKGPRPELKQYATTTVSGVVASTAWQSAPIMIGIANGNTASTRLGRAIRVRRIRLACQWTAASAIDSVAFGLLRLRDDAISASDAIPTNDVLAYPITEIAVPVGPWHVDGYGALIEGYNSTLVPTTMIVDVNLNQIVRYDDSGNCVGPTFDCFYKQSVTNGTFRIITTIWFEDA